MNMCFSVRVYACVYICISLMLSGAGFSKRFIRVCVCIPQMEEIGLIRITTAMISNKFSQKYLYRVAKTDRIPYL